MLEEVALTWKLIKQFHLRANATDQHPNAETRILLTNTGSKSVPPAVAGGSTIPMIDVSQVDPPATAGGTDFDSERTN